MVRKEVFERLRRELSVVTGGSGAVVKQGEYLEYFEERVREEILRCLEEVGIPADEVPVDVLEELLVDVVLGLTVGDYVREVARRVVSDREEEIRRKIRRVEGEGW